MSMELFFKRYKWDYWTYKSQPPFVITNIINLTEAERVVKEQHGGDNNN